MTENACYDKLSGQNPNAALLKAHLDGLLSRYLELLDRHECLREFARQNFKAGYTALAEANFRSSNRAVRYGQDFYDEKMKATLTVDIHKSEQTEGAISRKESLKAHNGVHIHDKRSYRSVSSYWKLRPCLHTTWEEAKRVEGIANVSLDQMDIKGSPDMSTLKGSAFSSPAPDGQRNSKSLPFALPLSRKATPVPARSEQGSSSAGELSHFSVAAGVENSISRNGIGKKLDSWQHQEILPSDPIRQFGVLVPMALRSAQVLFRNSVLGDSDKGQGGWIEIAELDGEMRALEIEVRRTRKRLSKISGLFNEVQKI